MLTVRGWHAGGTGGGHCQFHSANRHDQRDQASLQVSYYGDPNFTPIAGTALSYAANSQTPVVMAAPNDYFACQRRRMVKMASALGPWAVATSVPSVIYTIPASCPIHYVTYAYVYGSTPSAVYVGYTPGYMGTVVAPGGVVVYGTGYSYPATVVGANYVSYPATYGYGASFALGRRSDFHLASAPVPSQLAGAIRVGVVITGLRLMGTATHIAMSTRAISTLTGVGRWPPPAATVTILTPAVDWASPARISSIPTPVPMVRQERCGL